MLGDIDHRGTERRGNGRKYGPSLEMRSHDRSLRRWHASKPVALRTASFCHEARDVDDDLEQAALDTHFIWRATNRPLARLECGKRCRLVPAFDHAQLNGIDRLIGPHESREVKEHVERVPVRGSQRRRIRGETEHVTSLAE